MEVEGRTDALEARDRCLQAIVGADYETACALWRAAKRYNARERTAGLEFSHPLPPRSSQGATSARL